MMKKIAEYLLVIGIFIFSFGLTQLMQTSNNKFILYLSIFFVTYGVTHLVEQIKSLVGWK